MSIQLDPVELGFRRPFTQEVTELLRLRNPNSDPIAFKVKTTAPKQYCVRPNSGRIDPGQNVEVQVLLQAMKEDPPLETKCRDKFLVQSVMVPANQDFKNWSDIESSSSSKSSIQEKKIRVNFLPAPGQVVPEKHTAGMASTPRKSGLDTDDQPPAYSSPVSNAVTPARSSATLPTGPVSRLESRPEDAKSLGNAVDSAGSLASHDKSATAGVMESAVGAVTGAAAKTTNMLPTSSDELKAQLESANATILRLKEQIQDNSGLRQRKGDASAADIDTTTRQPSTAMDQAPSGVPVPVVAALCLVSFLLAYLLF